MQTETAGLAHKKRRCKGANGVRLGGETFTRPTSNLEVPSRYGLDKFPIRVRAILAVKIARGRLPLQDSIDTGPVVSKFYPGYSTAIIDIFPDVSGQIQLPVQQALVRDVDQHSTSSE